MKQRGKDGKKACEDKDDRYVGSTGYSCIHISPLASFAFHLIFLTLSCILDSPIMKTYRYTL